MTLTIKVPDEVASRLEEMLPPEERDSFAAAAIADALELRSRDSAECIAAVEDAIADMDAGRNLIPFDEVCRRWDAERAARTNPARS